MSADPVGRPESIEQTRHMFDNKEDKTYKEVTKPLRELLVKEATFVWIASREKAYQSRGV